MAINKVVYTHPVNQITTKVTTGMRKGQYYQLGQVFEKGKLKYQEAYVQEHNYFKHLKAMYDDLGKMIKGSLFREEFVGEEANKRAIHKFGVNA